MNLSYTRVQQFLTVVKHMNMNKAAQELFISQPAISASLAKLEQELGVPLFFRDKNKLILTPQAESLLPRFEQFRSAHDMLVSDAQSLAHPQEQQLSISFTGSTFFFPVFNLSGFFHNLPNLNIKMSYVDATQATTMLLTNQTDFALSYYPIAHALISTQVIMSEPIGLVVRNGHPLSSKTCIQLDELIDVPLCGLTKNHHFRILCDQICEAHNIHLIYTSECTYKDYFCKIQQANDTTNFLSTLENFTSSFLPLGYYSFIPINNDKMCREIGISYVTSKKKQYQYKDFLDYCNSNFVKLNHYVNKLSLFLNQQSWDDS